VALADRPAPGDPIAGVWAQADLVLGRRSLATVDLGGRHEDPNTGAALAPRRGSAPEVVERALAAANAAWGRGAGPWSGLPVAERASHLDRLADAVAVRTDAIAVAEALDTGVPVGVTRAIAGSLPDLLRAVAERGRALLAPRALPAGKRRVEVLRPPWGPAALVVPWNAPAPIATTKLANALVAGCPAVLKPSEHAPAACGLLADAAVEAGLPPGALQLVHGGPEVGARLAADARVRAISFTGSGAAGRAVAAAAAPRMAALQLELGARNPAVVLADADVPRAAGQLARGATKLNGQWCEAPRRVLVDAAVHDALVEALAAELRAVRAGPSTEPGTALGPIAHRAQRDRLLGQLEALRALGGTVTACGEAPGGEGFHLAPALVTGLPPDAGGEELLGPVLTVHAVAGEREALRAANAADDGLAAYVFAGDGDRAFALGRALHAGEVRLGGTGLLDLAPGAVQSFWGASGSGGHGAAEVLLSFTGARVVGEDDPSAPI
jgi:phenylacetaldehyde dehydrogenase